MEQLNQMEVLEDIVLVHGGGASGGGSINLFYKSIENIGNIESFGGNGLSSGNFKGGNGGAGSITIGNISAGTFVKD